LLKCARKPRECNLIAKPLPETNKQRVSQNKRRKRNKQRINKKTKR
jgi:hypothetical protein